VRGIVPQRVLATAEERARAIGIGADRVLICADAITEDAYLHALAASLGTSYVRLDELTRADVPLSDTELVRAAAAGLMPVREAGRIVWIIAPSCWAAHRLTDPRRPIQRWIKSFRLTSSDRLQRFVTEHAQTTLGRRAAYDLRRIRPEFSNASPLHVGKSVAVATMAILVLTALALYPSATIGIFSVLLCAIFLAAAALRLSSAMYKQPAPKSLSRGDDRELPIYTIICALYREEKVVSKLVAAIRALDYPIEKLDVKFVLEADDRATRRALDRLDLGPPFEIIIAPSVGPRTKPKALNVALPLARGLYTAVYDAEDTPEPDQLRRAVAAFKAADEKLACLQASLSIDNTADNWLVRMFTANYAGQFDVLLPGLAALHLPFPLGGSSNHFRTAALRQSGGWDPYNVTEDADLGVRLHRLGYRAAVLPSTTYEEAPARFVPWLKQRTRWYKGWMQTWLVHMRRPFRLLRELSPAGAVAFQLFLACNVFSALIHPLFMAVLCYYLITQPPLEAISAMGHEATVFFVTLLAGYASTIALDLVGLHRRGLLAHGWVLLLTPLYWFLLSLAAWRALFQLLFAPQLWEKTDHGLAKSSRLAQAFSDTKPRVKPPRVRAAAGPAAIMSGAIGRP
jgi:cellulose synthase/poly-beta-1,6-N-acetylglucosamine synthase-like glycosyltransferase